MGGHAGTPIVDRGETGGVLEPQFQHPTPKVQRLQHTESHLDDLRIFPYNYIQWIQCLITPFFTDWMMQPPLDQRLSQPKQEQQLSI
jgi:hypothetical protein